MKKTQTRKLRLNKTTLKTLDQASLNEVDGGTFSILISVIGCPVEIDTVDKGCVIYA